MIAAATWVVFGALADNAPAYTVVGVTLSFFAFLVRRWVGQIDNSAKAAADATREERVRSDAELAKVEARYVAEITVLKIDQSAMRSVISKMLTALMDIDSLSAADRAALRADAMRVLFPPKDPDGRQ